MSKCGKNISDTLDRASCATFLFLPHFDVICDLLLNRRTATLNLFVKYIYVALGEKNRETILSSLQVCFVIAKRERERERARERILLGSEKI